MNILVTNDDGICAPPLWVLVRELQTVAQVIVVAPDKEQSAVGTAVTLRQPVSVKKITSPLPGVEAYSVEGTPSDSVILALGKLVKSPIDLIVSGINHGSNLGDDALISGTVSAALQGYLRGFPAMAVSVERGDCLYVDTAARLAALLASKINSNGFPPNLFLNVNLPNLPLEKIEGLKITQLASKSHIEAIEEEHDNGRECYRLIRRRNNSMDVDRQTDIWAVENGNISITLLHTVFSREPSSPFMDGDCASLLGELMDARR